MISDGIENCINYMHNFNPDKSNNPFAYFTRIIYNAYILRIQKEKKQTYIKYKAYENFMLTDGLMDDPDFNGQTNGSMNVTDNMTAFVKDYEEKINEKRPAKKRGIEIFVEEE